MSYHFYVTEGIILSSSPAGESNRFYHLYTKEHGLVGVWGQGVRKLESKLRFHLQDFSHVTVHLIRGKNLWRLTDVTHVRRFQNMLASFEKRLVMGRFASLMKRLLEEESDPELYNLLLTAVYYLEEQDLNVEQLQSFELLFVLRILDHLGYGKDTVPREIIESYAWSDEIFDHVEKEKRTLTKIANMSLQQTHM